VSSDAVDTALATKLAAAAAPGGVHEATAPDVVGAQTHVVWSLMAHTDDELLGGAIETHRYLVKAVATTKAAADAAAARIQTLLQHGTLTVPGFVLRGLRRTERVAYVERDGTETWYHRGGLYDVSLDVTNA